MMIASWNGTDWVYKPLGQDVGQNYLAAEHNGTLHVVFSKNSFSNGAHHLTWYYATQDGSGWTYQEIEDKLVNYRYRTILIRR